MKKQLSFIVALLLLINMGHAQSVDLQKEFYINSKKSASSKTSNSDSSLKYAIKCYELAKQINIDSIWIQAYITMGNAHGKVYRFTESIDFYLKALKKMDDIGLQRKSVVYGNIGSLYMRQDKMEEAFKYFKKSYNLSLTEENYNARIIALNNMCDYYNFHSMPDSSIVLLKEAIVTAKLHNLKNWIPFTYDNLANAYFSKAGRSKSKEPYYTVLLYADTALTEHEKYQDTSAITYIYGLKGATYMKLGKYAESESFYNKYQALNTHFNDIMALRIGYEEMAMLFQEQKKFEQAYLYRLKYDSINKKYLTESSAKQMQELNTKYQTEKKEKENKLLLLENNLSEELIKRQQTTVILVIIGLVALIVVIFFVFRNLKNQKKANQIISTQKEEVESQKNLVEIKNKEITDSIYYAKRIQNAILTSEDYIKKNVNDMFIFYRPKDIVSGDFYWANFHDDKLYFITADCTGHGVPGAMLSMLGINMLNKLVTEKKLADSDVILNELRTEIINAINPEGSKEESKDGLDCCLLVIDTKNMSLEYSSANTPFFILRGNTITKCDADKMPVGKSPKENTPFKKNTIDLIKGDLIVTLTDGYIDQFGGPSGKKFKYKQFEEFLAANTGLPMLQVKNNIEKTFLSWKGNLDQIDDVCVIGIKI